MTSNLYKTIALFLVILLTNSCKNHSFDSRDLQQKINVVTNWRKVKKKCEIQDIEFQEYDSYWLIKKYKKSIYDAPENPESYFLYGRLLGLLKQPNQALHFFNYTLSKDPEYIWAFYSIGVLYLRKKALLQAHTFLEKCIELDITFTPALIALAKTQLEKSPRKALSLLQKAEKISPDDAEIKHHIANVLTIQKKHKEALTKYQESHALLPKDIIILNNWSKLLIQLKKYTKALETLKKVQSLLPKHKKRDMDETISLIMHLIDEETNE